MTDNTLMTSVSIFGAKHLKVAQWFVKLSRDIGRQRAAEKRCRRQRRVSRMAHGKHVRRAGRS